MIEINKLMDYEYISFDIFDTLIKRNCIHPHNVFNIVQNVYNKKFKDKILNFSINRIKSEKKATQNCKSDETTFDEIYKFLEKYYTKEKCKKLKKIEISVEINICQKNKDLNDVLQYCIKNNKKIILTSDMYLDKSVIKRILAKNNIKYYKLFLSSDYKVTKYSGNLFLKILENLNINKNQIIHIGDNYKSDYRQYVLFDFY